MSISIRDITRRFGEQVALDDVSFEVRNGEIAGFIGPNGAGKSTLMRIITGYIPPTSGEVSVNGLDVAEETLQVRRITGYLPETNPLYTDMYVREYLGHVARLYGMGRKAGKAVKDIIEKTGLSPGQHKKIGHLSKGFRQRVGLAQALVHDPEILILDEPTSGLDPNQIVEIRELISELGKEKTVMLSTHIMQEVEAICDRVVIIHQGRIVADELTRQITSRGEPGPQTIVVEFDGQVTKEQLLEIEQVREAVPTGGNLWLIRGLPGTDNRPLIFELAVQKGIKVLSMQKEEKRLEDVFREITGKQ